MFTVINDKRSAVDRGTLNLTHQICKDFVEEIRPNGTSMQGAGDTGLVGMQMCASFRKAIWL